LNAYAKKYLIVNADDFRLSPAVNRGIIEAHEHAIVTSASLIVRWLAATEAAVYSREQPNLNLGLHRNLGEWAYGEELRMILGGLVSLEISGTALLQPWLLKKEQARSIEKRVDNELRACAGQSAVLCYGVGNELPASIVKWYRHRRVECYLERLYRTTAAPGHAWIVSAILSMAAMLLALRMLLECANAIAAVLRALEYLKKGEA
jgi:hypothetical protein